MHITSPIHTILTGYPHVIHSMLTTNIIYNYLLICSHLIYPYSSNHIYNDILSHINTIINISYHSSCMLIIYTRLLIVTTSIHYIIIHLTLYIIAYLSITLVHKHTHHTVIHIRSSYVTLHVYTKHSYYPYVSH